MRDDFGSRPYSVRFPYGREGFKKGGSVKKKKKQGDFYIEAFLAIKKKVDLLAMLLICASKTLPIQM